MSRRKNERGIALILVITIITMVSLLLTAYVAMTVSERKRTEHETGGASARYIAKAGIEQVFFDLSSEYEKDNSWVGEDKINGRIINDINGDTILNPGEGMPAFSAAQTEAPGERSNYQPFYNSTPFPDATTGNYTVKIAFVNNITDDAFLSDRVWVRSTGTAAATGESVTLTQLAKVRPVALVEINSSTGDLVEIERLYDTLDNTSDSLVDNPGAIRDFPSDPNRLREIRISGATLNENVLIDALGAGDVFIRGGYDYTFTDGQRNPDLNKSVLTSTTEPTVAISGSGMVKMSGIRIK